MSRPAFDEFAAFISEGVCPRHRTPLERRDECGYCTECDRGWQLRPATEDEKWMGDVLITEFFDLSVTTYGEPIATEEKK